MHAQVGVLNLDSSASSLSAMAGSSPPLEKHRLLPSPPTMCSKQSEDLGPCRFLQLPLRMPLIWLVSCEDQRLAILIHIVSSDTVLPMWTTGLVLRTIIQRKEKRRHVSTMEGPSLLHVIRTEWISQAVSLGLASAIAVLLLWGILKNFQFIHS